jgi:hypothetical protein
MDDSIPEIFRARNKKAVSDLVYGYLTEKTLRG